MTPVVMPPQTEKTGAEMTPVQAAAVRAEVDAEIEDDRSGGWGCTILLALGIVVGVVGWIVVLSR